MPAPITAPAPFLAADNGSAAILAAPTAAPAPSFAAFVTPAFVKPPATALASPICCIAAIAELPASAAPMIPLALLTAKAPPMINTNCAI